MSVCRQLPTNFPEEAIYITARYAEFSPDNRWLAAHGIS